MQMAAHERVDVMHVIGSLVAGGAECFVVDLICALKRNGLAVGLAVLGSAMDATGVHLHDRLRRYHVPLHIGPTVRVGYRSLLWYRRTLAFWQPKVVHLHTENTELAHYLAKSFMFRRPHIVRTLHTTQPSSQWLHRRALRGNSAALSIACGPAVLERFATEVRGSLMTISNGVDFHWPSQNSGLKAQWQHVLGWCPSEFHFVHIGGIRGASLDRAAKAHDVLIRAWHEAEMGKRGAYLHLVGDGNLRAALERLADYDPSIVFHGIQPNVWQWLLAADCFVMPSRFEGLPIAGIEALGSGLPCILSTIEPLRRLANATAWYVPADNQHALAEQLVKAMTRIRLPTPEEVATVRRTYGIDNAAERYSNAYANVMGIMPDGDGQRVESVS